MSLAGIVTYTSPFLCHVCCILGVRSGPQVTRLDAQSIVTGVTHQQTLRDFPLRERIAQSMGPHHLAIDLDGPITVWVGGALPL